MYRQKPPVLAAWYALNEINDPAKRAVLEDHLLEAWFMLGHYEQVATRASDRWLSSRCTAQICECDCERPLADSAAWPGNRPLRGDA